MLKEYLDENGITIYQLAKDTGIAYSTMNYIATGRTDIKKATFENVTKIKDSLHVSYEDILQLCAEYSNQDFEVFKSSVCHEVKQKGNLDFILDVINSDEVERKWKYCRKQEAQYLVGMVDYLSRIENIDRCTKYDKIRAYKFEPPMFPLSFKLRGVTEIPDNAIPEFLERGIVEGDVFNVA